MSEQSECTPISYVHGGITLNPKPPPPFNIGVRVDVGPIQAAVTEVQHGERHLLWHYLAVVKPSNTTIRCTIGDVTMTKEVEAKPATMQIVNFCFGEPVVMSPDTKVHLRPRGNRKRIRKKIQMINVLPSSSLPDENSKARLG